MFWQQAAANRESHRDPESQNVLMRGDVRTQDLSEFAGKVQCVYLDPPFFTGDDFTFRMRVGRDGWGNGSASLLLPAYSDKKTEGREKYLALLRTAITQARLLLTDSGAFFLHLDSRMSAYARLICDEVFDESNFVNEIIWAYQSGGRSKRHFSRKHDVILFYSRSDALFFDIAKVAVSRKDNRSNHMRRSVDASGRYFRTIRSGGKIYTYYDDDPVFPDDVWNDVSHLQQKDPQRTGYDTQKPQALLDRIILCSTREGDLVADLFCGSGTTLFSAAAHGRRFLGMDINANALSVCRKRLLDLCFTLRAPTSQVSAMLDASITPGLGYYVVRLNSYSLPADAFDGILSAPKELKVEGLDAVDQWSAGFFKAGEFIAHASCARRKQTPELPETLELPLLRGIVAILIVDVLGNRTVWTGGESI
jgi:DNA modification methylase